MNTDREEYGGSGKVGKKITLVREDNGSVIGLHIALAPLSTMIFEVTFS